MLNLASKNWYPIYYLISDQGGMYCEVNEAEIRDETADYTEIPNNLVRRLVSPVQVYCTISTQLYILSFGKPVMLFWPEAMNSICEIYKEQV